MPKEMDGWRRHDARCLRQLDFSPRLFLAEGRRRDPCVALSAGCTGVLVEALLRNPVKGERSYGRLQMRCDKAPQAMRAAPAGKIFVVGPDHVSSHGSFRGLDFGIRVDFRGRESKHAADPTGAEPNSWPSFQRQFLTELKAGKSNYGASPERPKEGPIACPVDATRARPWVHVAIDRRTRRMSTP
jgi:hypothetical protein